MFLTFTLLPPSIIIPSSSSTKLISSLSSPRATAFNLSDSFTRSSSAPSILVWPEAKEAAIQSIGISSIRLAIMLPPIFIPCNSELFTLMSA